MQIIIRSRPYTKVCAYRIAFTSCSENLFLLQVQFIEDVSPRWGSRLTMQAKIWKMLERVKERFAVCEDDDYRQARTEVVLICISAFLPLWAGLGLFTMTKRKGAAAEFGHHFMASGEMLLIACAIIGPLIYFITRKYGRLADPLTLRFPFSTTFSVMIVLIWFVAGGIFVSKKISDAYQADVFDNDAMWYLSLVVTVAAVLILYFATLFRNSIDRVDPGKLMHDEQEKFVRDFDDA